MGHKDSMVLVEQVGVRSQTQYKQEYLATLFTSDTLYGVKAMRTAATTGAALSSSAFAYHRTHVQQPATPPVTLRVNNVDIPLRQTGRSHT